MKKLVYIAIFLQLCISSLLLADPNDRVTFVDPNLATAVADALELALPVTEGEMANLHSLVANNLGISDLTGLEYAVDVNELHLSDNLISDLSPISGLTSLIYLYLNNNQIADISDVSGLANLDTLFLSINLINDISPVYGLTGLTSLYLGTNQISNISSLSGLPSLTMLDLTNNLVADISVLDDPNLMGLEQLYLAHNLVVNVSPVSSPTSLQHLHLTDNLISDLSGLTGGEPNDLISLLLDQNALNTDAYCIHLPIILGNNPLLEMTAFDENPNPELCTDASDECATAVIAVKGFLYDEFSTAFAAATEAGDCGGLDLRDNKAVWHSYTPASDEVVDISICGSSFDTTLEIYDACPEIGGTEVACNDDYCGRQSLVTLELTGGETYLIRIAGDSGDTGSYELSITDVVVENVPVNNTCGDVNEVFPYIPVTGSTAFAYGTDITSCTGSDTRDVWYYFDPPISGLYMMDPNGSEYGFDTSLAVFDGCEGEPNELVCNDDYSDGYPNYQSRIVVSLDEAQTYYIRISATAGAAGNYSLVVTMAADTDKDGDVDIDDLIRLVKEWLVDGISCADIAPEEADGGGDKEINVLDFGALYEQWQWGVDP